MNKLKNHILRSGLYPASSRLGKGLITIVKKKKKRNWKQILKTTVLIVTVVFLFVYLVGGVVHAAGAGGLVDNTVDTAHEYSKYPIGNYQLDYFVKKNWDDWAPWKLGDNIGKQVMFGLYCITNFIWWLSLNISNATGYLVKEAFSLDFIGKTANKIGTNIQTIAGVTKSGMSTDGFYPKLLFFFLFVVGIYVAYTGLIKRETTKAVKAVTNFVIVFIISGALIAYVPDYIKGVNQFSSDLSTEALTVGTKITMPDSKVKGKDSVDLIRDSLHNIQIKTPWLLLQFGTSDTDKISKERIEKLVSKEYNSKERTTRIKEEAEDEKNTNITAEKVIERLGTVVFLFVFNIGISVFVFLLTGIMLFSQVMFIILAMFLPVALLLSTLPTFEGTGKRAVMKLFNTILTRAGITLVISVAFSLSAMLYSLAGDSPFFLIAFLQIIVFAGIYFKLGDILSMFSLESGDAQGLSRSIMRRPRMMMARQGRKMRRALTGAGILGGLAGRKQRSLRDGNRGKKTPTVKTNKPQRENVPAKKSPLGARMGQKAANVLDTPSRVAGKVKQTADNIKNAPINARYAMNRKAKELSQVLPDFKNTVSKTLENRQTKRTVDSLNNRSSVANKRKEMEKHRMERERTKALQKRSNEIQRRNYQPFRKSGDE